MGCFSYICKECQKPVNSDSFTGERVNMYFLRDGKVIESMSGPYDSYGRVFAEDLSQSIEWTCDEWGSLINEHFNDKDDNGFAAIHTKCFKDEPSTISIDDPDQGWGTMKKKHLSSL